MKQSPKEASTPSPRTEGYWLTLPEGPLKCIAIHPNLSCSWVSVDIDGLVYLCRAVYIYGPATLAPEGEPTRTHQTNYVRTHSRVDVLLKPDAPIEDA